MPRWAILERQLFTLMDKAIDLITSCYLEPEGGYLTPDFTGFKFGAVDNSFESFHSWPLYYIMGGDRKFLELSHREHEIQLARVARDGTFHKEFYPHGDWMHMSEGCIFFYYLNLADPDSQKNRDRSVRFAGFFLNEDPDIEAKNYDSAHNVFRSPRVGSMGASIGHGSFAYAHWLDTYGMPYYDVPGVTHILQLDGRNPELSQRYNEVCRKRMGSGDTITGLMSTSLMLNAYLHTGDSKYEDFIVRYVEGWRQRYDKIKGRSHGMVPDNAGPSGEPGELFDGKWYGATYGWTWPHGYWMAVGDSLVIGSQNEKLFTGRKGSLDWVVDQQKILLAHARTDANGSKFIPMKYTDPDAVVEYADFDLPEPFTRPDRVTDKPGYKRKQVFDGFFEFAVQSPNDMAHAYFDAFDANYFDLIKEMRNPTLNVWDTPYNSPIFFKNLSGQTHPYMNYLSGKYPNYPEEALQFTMDQVYAQLKKLRAEQETAEGSYGYQPENEAGWNYLKKLTASINKKYNYQWSESTTHNYFQQYLLGRSVTPTEALVQLTLGGPMPIYNGGLLHVTVRYFDADERRPGLPEGVAALVSDIQEDRVQLMLCNTDPRETRRLIVQGGAFGEHSFTTVAHTDADGKTGAFEVGGTWFEIEMGPGSTIEIDADMARFSNKPSYQQPL